MIYGIGTDICHIPRIEAALKKQGDKFIARILTPQEITHGPNHITPIWLAKRWAAKEALSKALGTGIGKHLGFQDIQITKASTGQPLIQLSAKHPQHTLIFHLSLSSEDDYAIAYVIAEDMA